MRKFFPILLILCLFLPVLGHSQTSDRTITYDGQVRTYRQYLPPSYSPGTELPVLLMLHGLGDTGPNFMTGTGFNSLASSEGFITVAPDALPVPFVGSQGWNAGASPFITTDDIGFLGALLDTLEAQLNIDEDRVYTIGFSLGSMMTHRVACEMSDRIAAVASSGGPIAPTVMSACNPCREVPLMFIHGTNDSVLFWEGTSSFIYEASSVPETMEHWAGINGCGAIPDTTPVPDAVPDGLTFDKIEYTGCSNSSETILYRVNGGEHAWYLGADVDFNTAMWSFLSAHSLTVCEATGIHDQLEAGVDIEFGPNPLSDELLVQSLYNSLSEVVISDMTGREIFKTELQNQYKVRVPVSNLPAGLYMLNVRSGDRSGTFRLVQH